MKLAKSRSSRPLLNWVLARGHELLTFQVQRSGGEYSVSVAPKDGAKRLYMKKLDDSARAFHLHAALVEGFRDAGWTSIAYR
jgi:hypothetical protein